MRFAGYLTCCIILAVTIFACFLKTSGIEVKRITEQALEYDHIYAKELSLSNSRDTQRQPVRISAITSCPNFSTTILRCCHRQLSF